MLALFHITEVKMSDYTAIQELLVVPYLKDVGKKQDFYFSSVQFLFRHFFMTVQLAVSID